MVDPCTYLTAAAVVNSIAGSVVTGMAGNAGWAAVLTVYGKVDEWRRGQGQPVNHHLQRALRISLLSATKQPCRDRHSRRLSSIPTEAALVRPRSSLDLC